MTIQFYKFEGCGNDFIIIDNREVTKKFTNQQIRYLCDRHFGIGADGLMLYNKSESHDFAMTYFNSDGFEGSMCGNGGRCILAFSQYLGNTQKEFNFIAVDGEHQGSILNKISDKQWQVQLKMNDVSEVTEKEGYFEIDTGSPHYVKFIESTEGFDVFNEGRKIRHLPEYGAKGINVNFVQETENGLFVRTFERGVENETLACGTGVTASALAYAIKTNNASNKINIQTLGGKLNVSYEKIGSNFKNICLEGPATFVFKGEIEI